VIEAQNLDFKRAMQTKGEAEGDRIIALLEENRKRICEFPCETHVS
jgi:hypothetical protein